MSTSSVLVPPPDIKKIIDVLAVKVVANGEEFAKMLSQHMADNIKYDFLRDEDNPYRPYYLQAINQQPASSADGQQEIRRLIFEEEAQESEDMIEI